MKRSREVAEEKWGEEYSPATATKEDSPAAPVTQKKRKVVLQNSFMETYYKKSAVSANIVAEISKREKVPPSSVEVLVCTCRILNLVDAKQVVSRTLTKILADDGISSTILKSSPNSIALSNKARIMERIANHILRHDSSFRKGLGLCAKTQSLSPALVSTNEAVSRFFANSPQVARALLASAQASSLPA